jgi:signal transduction histidine kinase
MPCPKNRGIEIMVNDNQGILKAHNQNEEMKFDQDKFYHLLVVTGNLSLSDSLGTTLEHFFLNRRRISVIQVMSFQDAMAVMEQKAEIIMVVVDDHIHLNGAYAAFVEHIRNRLRNQQCIITLKGDLIHSKTPIECSGQDELTPEFLDARERLIDITRMILLTSEMESRIDYQPDENFQGNKEAAFRYCESQKETGITNDRLYAIMAHDLKGPVGNIKVMLDFLTNEPELLDQETSKDLLLRVRESANNVHELLEDFLFWSRMIKQDVHFNPRKTDLEKAVRENIHLVKSLAKAKEIDITYSIPESAWVMADEYMLHTILRNLLYNAIKFTEQGGLIEVIIENKVPEYVVTIKDNGIGIPSERLEKLFHVRGGYTTIGTAREMGTGLGLALCKDFIEKNGGRISAESIVGVGSSFRFTLPVDLNR